MIIFYMLFAAVWLMIGAFWYVQPLHSPGPWAPYGAFGLAFYNLVRFGIRLWAGRPQKISHDRPYPDKPVIAPEFDFENRERRDS